MLTRLFGPGSDLGRTAESASGSLDSLDTDEFAARPVTERNALIARWLADLVSVPVDRVASDIPRLLGLTWRRPRYSGQINAVLRNNSAANVLSKLLEGELLAGERHIQQGATPAQLRVAASYYAGVSEDRAARTFLRAQRLRVFGNHLIETAVKAAKAGEMTAITWVGMTRIGPIGPIRLRAAKLRIEMAESLDAAQVEPQLPRYQAERDRIVELMIGSDLEPRLAGPYRIAGAEEPRFVLGFEHPAKNSKELMDLVRVVSPWVFELSPAGMPGLVLHVRGPHVLRALPIENQPSSLGRLASSLGNAVQAQLAFAAGRVLNVPIDALLRPL